MSNFDHGGQFLTIILSNNINMLRMEWSIFDRIRNPSILFNKLFRMRIPLELFNNINMLWLMGNFDPRLITH